MELILKHKKCDLIYWKRLPFGLDQNENLNFKFMKKANKFCLIVSLKRLIVRNFN